MLQVQAKMAAAHVSDDAYEFLFAEVCDLTMQKFHHRLKKSGRLGPIPTAAYYQQDKGDRNSTESSQEKAECVVWVECVACSK